MDERKVMRQSRSDIIHNIIMESRKKLSVSGVEDVESFHEEEIVLHTGMGILIVEGDNLHINKLSVDTGEVAIDGEISALRYVEATGGKGGFFGRLFK